MFLQHIFEFDISLLIDEIHAFLSHPASQNLWSSEVDWQNFLRFLKTHAMIIPYCLRQLDHLLADNKQLKNLI